MGHHLYEENKRLKAEIEGLRAQLRQKKQLDNEDNLDALAREAFKQILLGKAALVTTEDGDGSRITCFQMIHPPKPVDDNEPF